MSETIYPTCPECGQMQLDMDKPLTTCPACGADMTIQDKKDNINSCSGN